jgi:hypothetical protein
MYASTLYVTATLANSEYTWLVHGVGGRGVGRLAEAQLVLLVGAWCAFRSIVPSATLPPPPSFIHVIHVICVIHLFIHVFLPSFLPSFLHACMQFIHSFIHSFMHSVRQ